MSVTSPACVGTVGINFAFQMDDVFMLIEFSLCLFLFNNEYLYREEFYLFEDAVSCSGCIELVVDK
jgi:hypothetical protein